MIDYLSIALLHIYMILTIGYMHGKHNHAKTCDLNKMCQIVLDTSDTLGIFTPRKSVSTFPITYK